MLGRQRQAGKLRIPWPSSLAYSMISTPIRNSNLKKTKQKRRRPEGVAQWLRPLAVLAGAWGSISYTYVLFTILCPFVILEAEAGGLIASAQKA